MIRGVNQVGIQVKDQEEAKKFWVDKLGFTVAENAPYGEERWLSVLSPDGATKLVLGKRQPDWRPELVKDDLPHSNVFFYADDVEQTYQELVEKGVHFPAPPTKQFFGWWSMFEDPDGVRYALGQRWGTDSTDSDSTGG